MRMAKAAKKKTASKATRSSRSGEFVVARPAVRSDKFTSRQIREAVEKVKRERAAKSS